METPRLQLLRRHGRACAAGHPEDHYTDEFADRRKHAKRCTCPIVVGGTLAGVYRKKTTRQTDWELARQVAALYAAAGTWNTDPVPPPPPPEGGPVVPPPAPDETAKRRKLLAEAIAEYLEEHRKEKSAAGTIKNYRLTLGEMQRFGERHGLLYLEDWNRSWVRLLRDSWQVGAVTRSKKLAALKPFFEFFVDDEILASNPARIKQRRNRTNRLGGDLDSTAGQKNPFTNPEVERMIAACDALGKTELRQWPKKKDGRQVVAITEFRDYHRKITGEDLRDFIYVSIYTGLRISHVATFDIARLTARGEVKLRATKNGAWICVPIPPWLQQRIRWRAERYGAKIFRPTGNGIDAITQNWRRPLNDLWQRCGPWETKPTPHRFRHTFVRILLDRRLVDPSVTLALIATLAGDTEEMIRRHYSGFMGDQQQLITHVLNSSFAKVPRLL